MAKDSGACKAFMKRAMGAEKAGMEAMKNNRKAGPGLPPVEKGKKK